MSDPIEFNLDGKTVTATADETIWQVAQRLGTEIPHLCYRPSDGYRADGNCRACMVEIAGERTLAASCIRKPSAGMNVQTGSERARQARQLVFDLLLSDQPGEAHDPNSALLTQAQALSPDGGSFPARAGPKSDNSQIGRAHVRTPVTRGSRMPSSA